MKNWFNTHYKTLIIAAFLIPIMTVAIVSISHVTKWYGISNPVTWSVYLSIGIEIAALSALAAISANMGKKVYFPFAIVTIVQFIGNIYFAYSYIDITSKSFQDWVGLVSPFVEFMGVDPTDFAGHKRFLAFFAGGMLPLISLSFLHMLVKFTEEDRIKDIEHDIDEKIVNNVEAKDIIGEVSRLRLSDKDLELLEKHLLNSNPPNEALTKAAEEYKKKLTVKESIDSVLEETNEKLTDDEEISVWDSTLMDGLEDEEPFFIEEETENIFQEEPTEEEIEQNFSTITPEPTNIFQEEEIVEPQPEVQTETFTDEFISDAIDEFNQQSIEDEFEMSVPEPTPTSEEVEELKVDVVVETPVENVINVVIDDDILIPPTQTEPLPTPQEQVISVNFSIPEEVTNEIPTIEAPTLENSDVEKKNN